MNKQMSAPIGRPIADAKGQGPASRPKAATATKTDDVMRGNLSTLRRVEPKLTRLAAPKIVQAKGPDRDPKSLERARMVDALLAAQGPSAVTRAADALAAAGHEVPDEQEPWLQLLEHASEEAVQRAIESLARLLAIEPPRRLPLLEQRLLRIEEHAELTDTRAAAGTLRRSLGQRSPAPPAVHPRTR